jgi:anti-sigma28 factor (negative regulator of flagellin synthesis)
MIGRAPLPIGAAGFWRRRRYVNDLRRRIAAGTYRVRTDDIADAVLRDLASRDER